MEKSALPKPNVTYLSQSAAALDEESIKGMICNPIYTGLPPFQQVISDEAWVQAATQLIAEEGPEQFLVNMLYMLRHSMDHHFSAQASRIITMPHEADPISITTFRPLYCYHDGFPIVELYGSHVCVAEYIFEHLEDAPVTDLITEPPLSLVFQNGHTLPLIAPDTGQPFYVDDEDLLLNNLNGLSILDTEWDEDDQAVILHFDRLIPYHDFPGFDENEAIGDTLSLAVHLDSIRRLTCPYLPSIDLIPDDE